MAPRRGGLWGVAVVVVGDFDMNTVDVIVVNWNAGALLRECVASIEAVAGEVSIGRIVVVDNASTDGSVDFLHGSEDIILLENAVNRGFAAACNQGARGSAAEYLLFLNPDMRLRSGSLRVPAAFLDDAKNADVGIVGIQLVDERDRVLRTCARLPTPGRAIAQMLGLDRALPRLGHFMLEWDHDESRQVDQVMGAFFFTRRRLFEELGGFDERFFVYLEEVDFSLRARRLSWSTWYLPGARAYHRGGGTTESVKDRRLFYALRSRILYFYKHYGRFAASAYVVSVFSLEFVARLVANSARRDTLRAYGMLCRELRAMRSKARA